MRTLGALLLLAACWVARGQDMPREDVRLNPEFLEDLSAYKKDFRLPEWARQGMARQVRFDGGPMFAACQLESKWPYLFDPATPGFVGIIRSVWTLTNLYTDHLERRLAEIRAAGYNWAWVSYQLGYAFDDEQRQREQVRRLIQLAHARGIRITAYFSLTSVFTRSAFVNQPESKQWIQEDPEGKPVAYSGLPERLMACVNKPGRLAYLKKVVRAAAEDGADDIYWDSIFNRCHCSDCRQGFREYSRRVLGRAYEIPAGPSRKEPIGIQEDTAVGGKIDPARALFGEYGNYAVARAIAELDRHAKSINPRITVSANTHRFRYVDHVTDITWSEDSNRKGARIADGKLYTPMGIYAWCQATAAGKKPIQLTVAPYEYWQLQKPEYYQLTVADAASFQSNFTMLAGYAFSVRYDHKDPVAIRSWGGISKGLNFVERNQALYQDAAPAGDIAIYYSHPSRILGDIVRSGASLWSDAVQAFYRAGYPVRVLTDETAVQAGAAKLAGAFKLIVLAGMPALSDNEVALLKGYAALGGKLMFTPDAGQYTSFATRRANSPWHEQRGLRPVRAEDLTAAPAVLSRLVQETLNRPPMVRLGGDGFQVANPTLQRGRLIVHLMNYESEKPQTNFEVRLSAAYPAIAAVLGRAATAQWISPDEPGPLTLKLNRSGGDAIATIPELKVNGLLVLTGTK